MDPVNFEPDDGRFDQAVADRLARLRALPVDTSRLDDLIGTALPQFSSTGHLNWSLQRFLPMRAIAASFLVISVIAGILLSLSSRPVEASVIEMAQFHNDLVSGRVPVTKVDSIQDANHVLAAQWAESPQMPGMPDDHVMACCMRSVKNRKMVCVLLKGDGEPVSMTVANASDMQTPTSPVITRNGIAYHIQTTGSLNMVMTQRGGRWVCLIARLPKGRLMDMASSLQF